MKFAGSKTKRAVRNFEQYKVDAAHASNTLDGLLSEIGKKAQEDGITRNQVLLRSSCEQIFPPENVWTIITSNV